MEGAVSERCKAFAAVHRSDENRQAYISASQRALTIIAKAKTETSQTTCFSLSTKSNPKSVNSLLCSVDGSSSSSPNFPKCSSPRESALVYAAYLRSHFSVSQPKALRSRARGCPPKPCRVTCPEDFPISGLDRLGVKPRLCRSLWRAFASTHPLMLPSTSPREALLACHHSPPWSLPSFTAESTLSS